MEKDDILDRQLSPSAPPSLARVLELLRRYAKGHEAIENDHEDNPQASIEHSIAAIRAREAAAQRKIRQLAQEGHVLRRGIATLEARAKCLDDRYSKTLMGVVTGAKEGEELIKHLRLEASAFHEFVEKAAHVA